MLDGHKAPVFHAPAHCPWIWVKAQDGAFSYGLVPKLHPNVDRSEPGHVDKTPTYSMDWQTLTHILTLW
jgi:hypothetical protein